MEKTQAIISAASILRNAESSKTPCDPVRELIGPDDINAAYAVQLLNSKQRLQAGAKQVGAKIGLTSEAVQKQLGVDQPDYGVLYADTRIPDGGSISFAKLMQPKGEVEIAFILASDIDATDPSIENIVSAIDHGVVSIEIAGSRVRNWDIRIADTIADNASASHFVLGTNKIQLSDIDLTGCKMEMRKNGEVVSTGTGAACMGSPLNAIKWLAKVMAQRKTPLRRGDIILSGALGPMVNLEPGDHLEAFIEGMGQTSVHIEKGENMNTEELAELLDDAARSATATPQLSAEQSLTLDQAYTIQRQTIDRCIARGENLVGLKMGFTSVAKMEQMGVHDMIWGRLTDRMRIEPDGEMEFKKFIHPRVEPEIAFRISKNISSEVALEDVRSICDGVAPALEVIDSRYRDFKFSLEDVIADNCSSAGFVLGAWQTTDADLSDLSMELIINGNTVHAGSSNAILGDPWKSLQAATRLAAQYGQEIAAGSVILAGAATAAEFLKHGDSVSVNVEQLGAVGFQVA